jgi:hypothetical protein
VFVLEQHMNPLTRLAACYAAWQRRLTPPQALAVIVLGIVLIGAIALAAALLPPFASGACALTLAGLYLIWCARLPRAP